MLKRKIQKKNSKILLRSGLAALLLVFAAGFSGLQAKPAKALDLTLEETQFDPISKWASYQIVDTPNGKVIRFTADLNWNDAYINPSVMDYLARTTHPLGASASVQPRISTEPDMSGPYTYDIPVTNV